MDGTGPGVCGEGDRHGAGDKIAYLALTVVGFVANAIRFEDWAGLAFEGWFLLEAGRAMLGFGGAIPASIWWRGRWFQIGAPVAYSVFLIWPCWVDIRRPPPFVEFPMTKPTEADLNALDITDAEAGLINSIAQPLVPGASTDADDDLVQIDATTEGVVFITINRPAKRNAFNAAVIAALHEAFETLHGADHVRLVFVRGAGGTFCAGADLGWMADAAGWSESDNRDDAMGLANMLKALHEVPALTVALVEGSAMGGGAGLVAACDMAVAIEGARFAFSEVKLGLIPATIAPYVIDAIGARRARQLFLTANIFDADYAAHAGLIDMVLPEGSMDEFISMLSDSLTANAPGAMGDAKRLVNDMAGKRIDHALMEDTARRIARARVSSEGQEGVRAFLEKRKPAWAV